MVVLEPHLILLELLSPVLVAVAGYGDNTQPLEVVQVVVVMVEKAHSGNRRRPKHGWWRWWWKWIQMAGKNGGSGVVIIKVPDTVVGTFSGATFGNNAPDF
jgi:hypothetical protein